eukprot:6197007-Pleurochrysis_carterae.AAC.1
MAFGAAACCTVEGRGVWLEGLRDVWKGRHGSGLLGLHKTRRRCRRVPARLPAYAAARSRPTSVEGGSMPPCACVCVHKSG